MTDYTELVEALRDIEKTMFALGTSQINMDNVSISLAYDKGWGPIANDAADAIEALQAEMPKRGEIVRCMECKWYQPDLCANPWGVCFHEDWVENNIGHTVDEDGFCYRGEREVQE